MKKKQSTLILGAIINFILAIGHLVCMINLDMVFKIYGIDETMNLISDTYGPSIPYIITIIVALCFFLCGIYAFSACGIIRKLPLLRLGIYTIAIIFLSRALWGFTMLLSDFDLCKLSSTIIAITVGVLYLVGGIKLFRK